ncbi:hypothetical protein UFOVP434_106 [uncultured Caudovirales phage]|uniref:Uncharacterized protein n=1 Tax=uncultured Caudovirales phage TaxID=2100421 RepID=A0A6J5M8C6_9CAUD|nr:hypothetical protein UFOVP434_106 [uncultured Caudovirales phage]
MIEKKQIHTQEFQVPCFDGYDFSHIGKPKSGEYFLYESLAAGVGICSLIHLAPSLAYIYTKKEELEVSSLNFYPASKLSSRRAFKKILLVYSEITGASEILYGTSNGYETFDRKRQLFFPYFIEHNAKSYKFAILEK